MAVAVDFFVYVTASPEEAKQWFDIGGVSDQAEVEAPIGDSAYIDIADGAIHVLKGKFLYWITISQANEKQEKDLAASVAARN